MAYYSVEEIKVELRKHPVFSTFESLILDEMARGDVLEFPENQLVQEPTSQKTSDFLLVLDGSLEVLKTTAKETYLLDTLTSGAIIGEIEGFKSNLQQNWVRAKSRSHLLVIPQSLIDSFSKKNGQAAIRLFEYLNDQALRFLEKVNDSALFLIRQKKNMGYFIINLVVILSLFSVAVPYFQKWIEEKETIFATTPLIFLAVALLLIRLRMTRTPLSTVGITRKNLKAALLQSLLISFVLIGLVVLVKALFIYTLPPLASRPLFEPYAMRMQKHGHAITSLNYLNLILIYPLHAFLQEVLARGAIQGCFKQFFTYKYRNALAITLASLVFASSFAYYGIETVLAVFFPGILWGWWYSKVENIYGVALSHTLVGLVTFLWIGWF